MWKLAIVSLSLLSFLPCILGAGSNLRQVGVGCGFYPWQISIWGFRKWGPHIIVQTWSCLMGKHRVWGYPNFEHPFAWWFQINRADMAAIGFAESVHTLLDSLIEGQACRSNRPANFLEFRASSSTDILAIPFQDSIYNACYCRSDSSYTYTLR